MPAVHHQKWQPSEFHMGTTLLLHFHAPPLRTLPTQNDAADVPISTFYSAPFELALARSKRGEGRVGAADADDGGTTGLSSFLRDKIRSYHIVWAPEGPETRQCPPNSGDRGRVSNPIGPKLNRENSKLETDSSSSHASCLSGTKLR